MSDPSPALLVAVADGALPTLPALAQRHAQAAVFRAGDVDTPQALSQTAAGADALIVTLHRLSAEHIAALPDSVRTIGRAGVGLDTIDLAAAAARGIQVVYQPDYATNEVADHAVAMLLSTVRRICQANERVRSDGWTSAQQLGPVLDLSTATAGVMGTGRIGRATAARLRPFVQHLIGFDVPGTPAFDVPATASSSTVQVSDDLPAVLAASNVVSLHLPLTDATRHVIGAAELAALPAGAVLVNVSRGGLVDEAALVEALTDGHLAGAALDVFADEPLPQASPLRSAPNLVLTPHIAWYSSASGLRLADWTVADVLTVATGGGPTHGRIADAGPTPTPVVVGTGHAAVVGVA
ncbi:C-terminal binding protein [Nakamurella flavida]|uniref:C-terminal binding protein n=1 Tax=Nakamurella flavida TaxID=363630 RepID=A0A939C1N5_9ACTN|nr:C-terminal binding protein [Nakamurella flavida]MBM9477883.1 C-terminal binding protein [Nakamurella flavida]MDP9778403.1 D-3-phosphoglycerate dehydrogenase [Nakamurella flavida]